jgi:hypothetical protein
VLVAVLALLELSIFLGVETGLIRGIQRPSQGRDAYWWGDHPELGVWRRPNASFEHASPCFDVSYRTNSVGARDVERSSDEQAPRVVVLGDSFLEGWGVPDGERLSNRLEAATGIEHLNFAMPHFSPYQELLAYQTIAKNFEHDAVLIGILPANDFIDSDLDLAGALPLYEYRYRPYLVGSAPPYQRFDLREPGVRHALRTHSYAFNALLRVISLWQVPAASPVPDGEARRAPSWFYDYDATQLQRLAWTLTALAREAGDRPVTVLLVPVLDDFQRQQRSGPNPLAPQLAALTGSARVKVVDLLPAMTAPAASWGRYFFSCDYHWNAEGNQVAFERGSAALRRELYDGLGARPANRPQQHP